MSQQMFELQAALAAQQRENVRSKQIISSLHAQLNQKTEARPEPSRIEIAANDKQIKLVFAREHKEFEDKINELLATGSWRVSETRCSHWDADFFAVLIERDALIAQSEGK